MQRINDISSEIFEEQSYESLITSNIFTSNLNHLNNSLKSELEYNNYVPVLLGNLFYDHDQRNPPFYNSGLLNECEAKRIRLFQATKNRSSMFEIGLNGGHSAFLSLMANKELIVYSNDIAEFYPPCPDIHPEIYVPTAATTLKKIFGDRFLFYKGSCLEEVPRFVEKNKHVKLDLIHIDGAKHTYTRDFMNLIPLLADNALVIFDDSNNSSVLQAVNELIKKGYLHRTPDFPSMDRTIKYRNEILVYKAS